MMDIHYLKLEKKGLLIGDKLKKKKKLRAESKVEDRLAKKVDVSHFNIFSRLNFV